MKKLLALSMAAMMALGMTSAINAAEKDTTDIDTTKTEDKQEGEVWGSITDKELQQLKVTMPIKIEYVISKGETDGANKLTVGDYKIVVSNDSEVGVKLDKVKLTPALDSVWSLDPNAATDESDIHKVNIEIAGSKMKNGEEIAPAEDFIVGVNKSKSLGIQGNGSKVEITSPEASKLAFDVVYTISQVPVTPAP